MKNILAPSILLADFKVLGEQLKQIEAGGAEYIHFDVMDGDFVPSISFGMPVLSSIKGCTNQVMDVHLMITEPIRYVKEFKEAGADYLTVHYEACKDLHKTLEEIHRNGMKAGISIKPNTPVRSLEPYLKEAEMFLIMSVEPGFGGQSFIPASLEKISELKALLEENQVQADIEVDGGIYHSNVGEVLEAGANVIVSGSGVFKGDATENTKKFMEILKKYE